MEGRWLLEYKKVVGTIAVKKEIPFDRYLKYLGCNYFPSPWLALYLGYDNARDLELEGEEDA